MIPSKYRKYCKYEFQFCMNLKLENMIFLKVWHPILISPSQILFKSPLRHILFEWLLTEYYSLSSSSKIFFKAIRRGFSRAKASTTSIGLISMSLCVIKRQRLFSFDWPMVLRFQVLLSLNVEIFRSHWHEVIGSVSKIRSG